MGVHADDLDPDTQLRLGITVGVKSKRPKKYASQENEFAFQCRAHRLPPVLRDHRFAKERFGRQWRFDFVFLDFMLAVEIEGIVFRRIAGQMVASGRHASPAGFEEDCWKYYHASRLRYDVIRVTPTMVKDGRAIDMTQNLLADKGWTPNV